MTVPVPMPPESSELGLVGMGESLDVGVSVAGIVTTLVMICPSELVVVVPTTMLLEAEGAFVGAAEEDPGVAEPGVEAAAELVWVTVGC